MSCVKSQPALRVIVYLVYIDDSGSSGKNLDDAQARFQVVCAVLVQDLGFRTLEKGFAIAAITANEDLPPDFEFHASDLFHGTSGSFFEKWGQRKRFDVFEQCMKHLASQCEFPIVYGAVDKAKLAEQIYKSANPLDMSFRLCIEGIERWFREEGAGEMGLLIADTSDKGDMRNLKRVFREHRKTFAHEMIDEEKGKIRVHLLDDMYFGDSADSIGIQVADMCAFLINRHLAAKQDSEWLFKIIEPLIYSKGIRPE